MAWKVETKEPISGGPGGSTVYSVIVTDDNGNIRMTLGYATQAEADTAAANIRDALTTATVVA